MNSDYKNEYAVRIAKQLEGKKTTNEVRKELKSKGLDDQVVIEIMIMTRNILANKYLPKIREHLLKNKEIHGSLDFQSLEDDILNKFKKNELQKLADIEMNKIAELVKVNVPGEDILDQVDTRFLSLDIAVPHINGLEALKGRRKSRGKGGLRIFPVIGLLISAGLFIAVGKFSYSIPILVLYIIHMLFQNNDTE